VLSGVEKHLAGVPEDDERLEGLERDVRARDLVLQDRIVE